eukprot:1381454-Alexandrium_andersonii.AAC.1
MGHAPLREPPGKATVQALRREVAGALGIPASAGDVHHAHSPWRTELVRAVIARGSDPDGALPVWLEEGAPAGIAREVEPGGLFPRVDAEEAAAEVEVLHALQHGNHPSFRERHGQAVAPGRVQLDKAIEAGFVE